MSKCPLADLNPIEKGFSSLKAYMKRHQQVFGYTDEAVRRCMRAAVREVDGECFAGWFRVSGFSDAVSYGERDDDARDVLAVLLLLEAVES